MLYNNGYIWNKPNEFIENILRVLNFINSPQLRRISHFRVSSDIYHVSVYALLAWWNICLYLCSSWSFLFIIYVTITEPVIGIFSRIWQYIANACTSLRPVRDLEVVLVRLLADVVAGWAVLFVWQILTLANYKTITRYNNINLNDFENVRIACQLRRLRYSKNDSKTIRVQ